jgi:hypothetical protein
LGARRRPPEAWSILFLWFNKRFDIVRRAATIRITLMTLATATRTRNDFSKSHWRAGIAAVALLAAGMTLSNRIEPGVHVEKVTLAGNTPALKFLPAGARPHPVALLAHGYTASKETLFRYGEALAAAGFECFVVDLPGHGASAQPYTFMGAVHRLEEVSREIGPVDVFLGHSMGGLTGGEAVREGGMKTRFFVALGSVPILGEHGPPLLFLAGRFDEIFPPALIMSRTDARAVISPWSDHGLEIFDPLLVKAAVEAACATVGKTAPAASAWWCWRFAGVGLAMMGALVLALALPNLPRRWAWTRGLIVAAIFIVVFVFAADMWFDASPHPRHFPRQIAAIVVSLLVLLGAGRLRIPRWSFLALAVAVVFGFLLTGEKIRLVLMSHIGVLGLVLIVTWIPALGAGMVVGRIARHHGTRFDGDVAIAIIVGCTLFQWGQPPRMAPEAIQPHIAIKLDAKLLDACAGNYEFAPDNLHWEPFTLTVLRQGDHLAGQVRVLTVRQGAFDIFPESETNFFLKVTEARLTFIKNGKGEVTAVNDQAPGLPLLEGKKLKN